MGRRKNNPRKRHRSGLNPAWQIAKIDLAETNQERELGLIRGRHFSFEPVVEVESRHIQTQEVRTRKFRAGLFIESVGEMLFFIGIPTNSQKNSDSCSFSISAEAGIKFIQQ